MCYRATNFYSYKLMQRTWQTKEKEERIMLYTVRQTIQVERGVRQEALQ